MTCRKDYRDLTKDERDLFVAALYHLKSTGVIDAYATEHADNFGVAHGGGKPNETSPVSRLGFGLDRQAAFPCSCSILAA